MYEIESPEQSEVEIESEKAAGERDLRLFVEEEIPCYTREYEANTADTKIGRVRETWYIESVL
jgi:hypothetical protein